MRRRVAVALAAGLFLLHGPAVGSQSSYTSSARAAVFAPGRLRSHFCGVAPRARAIVPRRVATLENPFDVLGLSQDCDDEEIKPAFRKLARQLHPDVPETGSEARFKRLVWASRELASTAGRQKWRARGSGEVAMSLEEYELEIEDFAFDLNDWPFEELDDLLRISEEAVDTETMTDVRSSWCDDGFEVEDKTTKSARTSASDFEMIYFQRDDF
ncbi:dnaJ [Symbiodinium natans]|uniref:DnaJ protein n=1 Tax=Symbiodinium natans TaxID=878477 RepID=A0A812SH18_9DINO|nr:dnaJ [Symbiodinium natans]